MGISMAVLTKSWTYRVHRMQENELLFAVSDTGIGIPAEKLDAVFESFTQLDASTSRQHGGSGLGLAICKHFVEMMRGRIWVESEVAKGTTFYFSIPV